MLSAIGASVPSPGSPSAAGLQANLDRYQQELSDCVNCASANTTAGKNKILAISNKISQTRARIAEIAALKAQNAPPAATVPEKTANDAKKNSPSSNLGSRLDVFA